ncbi:hypothetical protein D3C80_1563590 [compost metagenome]
MNGEKEGEKYGYSNAVAYTICVDDDLSLFLCTGVDWSGTVDCDYGNDVRQKRQ